MKKPKTFFRVQGIEKFSYVHGETWATSEKEAIRNVARNWGLIQSDQYEYFKSKTIVKVVSGNQRYPKHSSSLSRWIKRQP